MAGGCDSKGGWWRWIGVGSGDHWEAQEYGDCYGLDRLREVEDRLTDKQWESYQYLLVQETHKGHTVRDLIHLDAKQKLTALVTVLRPVIKGAK